MKRFFLTIDVDYTDYWLERGVDELELVFDDIKSYLKKFPSIKTTWFVRIDDHIKELYGKPDFLFIKHHDRLKWLRHHGHEIGWHHHAYKFENGKWVQELNDHIIVESLKRNSELALKYGITQCRMGWGYHTNRTMKFISDCGFVLDSSAIPRPVYDWEPSKKNWAITPQHPYHPSSGDYRVEGIMPLKVLEVPISTVGLSASSDTQEGIIRYINPTYVSEKFKEAISNYRRSDVILIFHPYELIWRDSEQKSLLSFDLRVFRENIQFLMDSGYKSSLLKELISH